MYQEKVQTQALFSIRKHERRFARLGNSANSVGSVAQRLRVKLAEKYQCMRLPVSPTWRRMAKCGVCVLDDQKVANTLPLSGFRIFEKEMNTIARPGGAHFELEN